MYHPERIFQRRQAAIDATGEDSIEEISIEVDIGENRGMYKNILKNNGNCYQIPTFYFPKISKISKKICCSLLYFYTIMQFWNCRWKVF